MDIPILLQTFFSTANISRYEGSVKSLVEMVYWVTGVLLPERCLEDFLLGSPHFAQCRIAFKEKDCQIIVEATEI